MPVGKVTRRVAKATEKVPGLRKVPVVMLLSAAEVAMLARDHLYQRLTPEERRELVHLVYVGRGRRARLTQAERSDLERLLAKLEPRRMLGDAASRLSPVPIPKRLLYGRRG